MPRIFLAINLTAEIKNSIAAHVQQLRAEWPKATISWVRAKNLHLTVRFLGEVPSGKLNEVARAVEDAVIGTSPFEVEIAGTGAFPSRGTPRVLWVGIGASSPLSRLHENVERELAAVGFPREGKTFRPHLTVGRVRAPAFVREVSERHRRLDFAPLPLVVSEISVIESQLARTGPTYYERKKHKLRFD